MKKGKREGKVFIWKERIYVPDSVTLHEEILQQHHDHELAGHPGYTKMHELITQNYWWLLGNHSKAITPQARCNDRPHCLQVFYI